MKLTLPFFVIASLLHSVHGQQQESASLRGGSGAVGTIVDAEITMAAEDEPVGATSADFEEYEPASTAVLIPQERGIEEDYDEDFQRSRRLGLTDWTMCSASSQCNNGCCSGTYSGGVLKCTPLNGGYRSDLCVGGSGAPPPAPSTGSLGDWSQCSASSQCRNGCCSGTYSGGVLKCTPVGGYRADMCVGGQGGGGGSTLLTGSGSGTYYYDVTNRMCPGIDTSPLNNAYVKCTSNNPAFYKTLGQYGNNNIIAIDNNLLNAPGGRERYCGKQVRVYRNGVEVPGPFVIMDGCPTCGSTKLDFSLTALDRISGGNACQGGNIGGLSWTMTSNQIIPFVP